MTENAPEVFSLSRIEWQLFGSLTFKQGFNKIPGPIQRRKMFFALVRSIAKWSDTHFKKILWVYREEVGEVGGRLHCHYLIGGLPELFVTDSTVFAIMGRWESLGGGISRVTKYDSRLSGVEYVAKCLGAQYEREKFGGAVELILSYSVQEALGRRHTAQQENRLHLLNCAS